MKSIFWYIFFITAINTAFSQGQIDVSGARDHPLISRYPGSDIAWYEEKNFASYSIASGPQTGYKHIKNWKTVEGKITRIYYVIKGKPTVTEIYRNYVNAVEREGFKILVQGIVPERNVSQEVGGYTFLRTFYEKNPFPTGKNILITSGSPSTAGSCYLAAEINGLAGNAYIVLGGLHYSNDQKVFLLDVIETNKMEDNLVVVSANQMLKGIRSQGKFLIYGIYFDFDKSDVKPESGPTLIEITNLLNSDPNLNLYIVGHTDMEGKFDYNMELSKRRASSVVHVLISNYGINPDRLIPEGVGPLVPVATNVTENGRKENRRVELVLRIN